jgi:hypothetical protein
MNNLKCVCNKTCCANPSIKYELMMNVETREDVSIYHCENCKYYCNTKTCDTRKNWYKDSITKRTIQLAHEFWIADGKSDGEQMIDGVKIRNLHWEKATRHII